jgi:hypothetical protein
MYLILLLAVFALTGVFAVQNDSAQHFTLLGYAWTVPVWAPTVVGVAVVSVLFLLHMSHAGMGDRIRAVRSDRSLDEHRGMIDDLRAQNARLREELAAVRGELRGAARGGVAPATRRSWLDGVRALPGRLSGRSST